MIPVSSMHVDTCKHVKCCMFVMFVIHYGLIAHIQAHDKSLVFPSFPSSPVSSQKLQRRLILQSNSGCCDSPVSKVC